MADVIAVFLLLAVLLLLWFFSVYGAFRWPAFTMLTAPLISLAAVSIAVLAKTELGIIFAGAIFPSVLLVLALFRSDPNQPDWPHIAARWILILAVITGCVLMMPFLGIGAIFFAIFAWMLINLAANTRYEHAAYIVTTIGSCMRQNLPLAPALASAAQENPDKRARTLRKISEWLASGHPVSEAIQNSYPRCPGHIVAMIRVAESVDQLPLALKIIEDDLVQRADKSGQVSPVQPLYPLIVIAFAFLMVSGVMLFIIPKYEKVFGEFLHQYGASMPKSTLFLISAYHSSYIWLAGILGVIILGVIPLSVYVRFRPRRPEKPHLLSYIGDFFKWHLPFLHWFENNYSLLRAVEALRLALNAGGTVNAAIAGTLGLDINYIFRKRLARWHKKVERGEDAAAAARCCRLSNTLAWAFDANLNKGNTPAILETLETIYRANYSYRANLARYIAWPCTIVALGSLVGFIVYALFAPLAYLITTLSESIFS